MSNSLKSSANSKNLNTRQTALNIINKIMIDNAYPDIAIRNEFSKHKNIDSQNISLINEIVYGVIRWNLKIDFFINDNLKKDINKMKIKNLLKMGVYQLKFMDGIKAYASINETVELGKQLFGIKIGNFINAILRNIQRKDYSDIRFEDKTDEVSFNRSFPKWIINYWLEKFDLEKVDNLCSSLNLIPGLSLRTNTLKTGRDSLLENLIKEGIEAEKSEFSEAGINVLKRIDPISLRFYKEGFFSVQDEASQMISFLLRPEPGEKVLDACAAPGGKSTHLAEIMKNQGEIISLDVNNNRLRLVNNQAKRLGISIIKTENRDLTNLDNLKKYENYFDKILLDAPCSGLGTIRRNPDIKWTRKMSDINELCDIQYKILYNISNTLKPGGKILFSVCTLSDLENEKIIEKFLKNNRNFELEEIKNSVNIKKLVNENNFFVSYTDIFNMDCFFAAKLKKVK
ncbi:MAG: 16S rRNA (cytosine(967)-C(5))-methyltransferase RsmB [Thermodesulfobacteriota bacterium]